MDGETEEIYDEVPEDNTDEEEITEEEISRYAGRF